MSSRCRSRGVLVAALVLAAGGALAQGLDTQGLTAQGLDSQGIDKVRVCADPNNLPFSNDAGEGFENRIAELLAHDLDVPLEYRWWAQRRGFVRNTLRAGDCDIVIGVPKGYELTLNTRPYYRSSYVLLWRAGDEPYRSLDDKRLARATIGVQLIGDDFANTPPAHALTRRGIIDNVRGYPVYGDYRNDGPSADIVRAVADGEIDVALVWGPLAGYFAPRQNQKLAMAPLPAEGDGPGLPFAFDIAMGVRKNNRGLRDLLDRWLDHHRAEIAAILAEYGVPAPTEP
jgi:mxaJ protein